MTVALEDAVVGILGGTGPQGRGLARRLATAGVSVVVGSRDGQRASELAALLARVTGGVVRGMSNESAAQASQVVIVAVPWAGHRELLESLEAHLSGKVVVDCVNPLGFDGKGAYALTVPEGSAAEQARELLPNSVVVAAFHHVSAALLEDPEVHSVDTDVLVLGDDRAATDLVQELAGKIEGVRGVYGGRLRNARQVEALTANLISMNRRYKAHTGIRVTDLERATTAARSPVTA